MLAYITFTFPAWDMRHGEILRGYSEVLRVTSLGAGTKLELARWLGSLQGNFTTGSNYKAASQWKRNENEHKSRLVRLKTKLTGEYFVLGWRSADLGLLIALRKPGPGGCCWGQAGIWKLEPGHRAPGAASGQSRGRMERWMGRERDRFWRINEGGTFLGSLTKAQYGTQ